MSLDTWGHRPGQAQAAARTVKGLFDYANFNLVCPGYTSYRDWHGAPPFCFAHPIFG